MVTVLVVLCISHLAFAQLRQEPCQHLPGGTGKAHKNSTLILEGEI